ncbi:MAG: hypothetical protein K6F40_05670 [Bacteroidales bacterium]|nr:hypothetical protein [Bacteroidales bacterium]
MVRVKKSGEFDNRSPEGRKRNKRRGWAVAITTIGLSIAWGFLCEWDGKSLLGGVPIVFIVSGLIWKVIFGVFNIFH